MATWFDVDELYTGRPVWAREAGPMVVRRMHESDNSVVYVSSYDGSAPEVLIKVDDITDMVCDPREPAEKPRQWWAVVTPNGHIQKNWSVTNDVDAVKFCPEGHELIRVQEVK